jgi:hypothetical protein
VSALSVTMGPPPSTAVSAYFSAFHATAVHTWETGFPGEIPGWEAPGTVPYVTWLQPDGTSPANALLFGGITPPPSRIGYQIGDEPADLMALQAMSAGVTAVHNADPDALLVLNFSSDNTSVGPVMAAAAKLPNVDVFSMDAYTYSKGAYKDLVRPRNAALDGGKSWWRYANAYIDNGHSGAVGETDIRWDAFVGAAYGYTGLTWFIYQVATGSTLQPLIFTDAGDWGSGPTPQYAYVAAMNLEMQNLGRALVMLRSVDVRYVPSISLVVPAEVTAWSKGAGGDPYLSNVSVGTLKPDAVTGHFRDDCGETYLLVLNAGHEHGDFPNQSASNQDVTLSFDFSNATDPMLDRTAVLVLDPITGNVSSTALSSTGTHTAQLVLNLRGGGAVLLKYKNARPFALR